ncbi:MAG TPA: hypothetical protein VN854_00240 [Mycoplasmatales bacterium]|jgi:hypothetical protein|nr:hypothetical protein [Mycoplasmatales bacterium]
MISLSLFSSLLKFFFIGLGLLNVIFYLLVFEKKDRHFRNRINFIDESTNVQIKEISGENLKNISFILVFTFLIIINFFSKELIT